MTEETMGTSLRDRAGRASPRAGARLGHSATIASAVALSGCDGSFIVVTPGDVFGLAVLGLIILIAAVLFVFAAINDALRWAGRKLRLRKPAQAIEARSGETTGSTEGESAVLAEDAPNA